MFTPGTTANYADFQALGNLRAKAAQDPSKVTETVARQFEAVFTEMMLKSMRQAHLAEGAMDNSQSELYRDMFDKQVALSLSQHQSVGLAKVITKQLNRLNGSSGAQAPAAAGNGLPLGNPAATSSAATSPAAAPAAALPLDTPARAFPVPPRGLDTFRLLDQANAATRATAPTQQSAVAAKSATVAAAPGAAEPTRFESPDEFVRAVWPHAERAAARIGVDPRALVAQAALETGWGRAVVRDGSGKTSNNLFNIKAGRGWDGDTVSRRTLEYKGGVAVREQAAFRAYDSIGQSFDDYADFLKGNPRYQEALAKAKDPRAFIDALHRAGYATDPAYSRKVKGIMNGGTLEAATADLKSADEGTIT